jgi:ATP-dependent Clp protease adaptor protein ClpS
MEEQGATSSADAPAATQPRPLKPGPAKPKPDPKKKPEELPPYNVVLLNDDDHSYAYVIEMLGRLFAHPVELAFKMAKTVDRQGRVIVLTTHKELAELKCEQIGAYGIDPRVASCQGSMSALIEPAEGKG